MKQRTRIPSRVFLFAVLFALATVSDLNAQFFGKESLRGAFAFSLSGTFSSAPPPFTGSVENIGFTELGLFHFDGNGNVKGEYTFVVQAASLGAAVPYTATGTYSVDRNGRMVIRTEDYINGVRANDITYECVIVRQRRAAECVFTEVISFQQGPNPVLLPTAGRGKLEQQRFAVSDAF